MADIAGIFLQFLIGTVFRAYGYKDRGGVSKIILCDKGNYPRGLLCFEERQSMLYLRPYLIAVLNIVFSSTIA
jgi:hypothetical protein